MRSWLARPQGRSRILSYSGYVLWPFRHRSTCWGTSNRKHQRSSEHRSSDPSSDNPMGITLETKLIRDSSPH
jgi:hypothetical protein